MEMSFFIIVFFLGPLGLLVVALNRYNNRRKGILIKNTACYAIGIFSFIISSLISPGMPAYIIYEWSKSGTSGRGLVFFSIVPFSILAFFIGLIFFVINNRRKIPEKSNTKLEQ